MKPLLAFHNDPAIKRAYLARVRAHAKADEIIHGKYWENGKGCAVGCTIHSGIHANYENELGIPHILARLEDRLFEGMANDRALTFPARFLVAIPVGADLSLVWYQFAHWLLLDKKHGVIRVAKTYRQKEIIERVGKYCLSTANGEAITKADWKAAAAAAAAAAYADATGAAAYAAAYADATAAAAAAAYAAAAYAARKKHYEIVADKLCQLLKQAPIP